MTRRHYVSLVISGLVALGVVTACGTQSTATSAGTTTIQQTTAQQVPGAVDAVAATTSQQLGTIVTDQNGDTLYRFDRDTPNPSTSNCVGECATTWPPALTTSTKVSVKGFGSSVVGSFTRPDGTQQLTIGGWPVYHYSGDHGPGQVNGQGISGTWFAVTPSGGKASANGASGATLSTAQSSALGTIVIDADGFTMYRFDKDTPNPSQSNCNGSCAVLWPPEIVTSSNVSVHGVDPSLVGSVTREDGSKQLTIAGWPVYGYTGDKSPGDVNGQGVGGTWFAITPTGGKASGSVTATAQLPASGSAGSSGSGSGY